MQSSVYKRYMQMYAKKGIKLFGEIDISAMIKEFKQLDEGDMPRKPVVIPLNPDKLTDEERRQKLEAANLIKGKEMG